MRGLIGLIVAGLVAATLPLVAATAAPPVRCAGVPATIVGTPGNDVLIGTSGRDVIVGRGGDDVIDGLSGRDLICGGSGADTIDAGPGSDHVRGQGGDDAIAGGAGADVLVGGSGDDTIRGNRGSDVIYGSAGADRARGGRGDDQCRGAVRSSCAHFGRWAVEYSFDGDPAEPSQTLLPDSLDFVVTHRTHPKEHFDPFPTYPADHATDCSGPDPAVDPLPQHQVQTSHQSSGDDPDHSFFLCKNHMMSSMGDVSGYSVTAFWPKQEFDFSNGGTIEFDVNVSGPSPRAWWEILIMPADQLRVGAAHHWLPISETYPADRIVFDYAQTKPEIQVGAGAVDPDGIVVEEGDWRDFSEMFPGDPAAADRRIRIPMRIVFGDETIRWSIRGSSGDWEQFSVDVPGGLPFRRGLVVFKTHAYTPEKDGNLDHYTFHWDNIRFSGPVVGEYVAHEADEVVYLEANGNKPIGSAQDMNITLPSVGHDARLFVQVHKPMGNQVQLSINGSTPQAVKPDHWMDEGECSSSGWSSIVVPLDSDDLLVGDNTLTWTVGPRPGCMAESHWDGFSVKNAEIQFSQ